MSRHPTHTVAHDVLELVTVEEWEPGLPTPWGWGVLHHPESGQPHTMPLWDTGVHAFDMGCECIPLDDEGSIVHNAFDRRESYEQGRARTH